MVDPIIWMLCYPYLQPHFLVEFHSHYRCTREFFRGWSSRDACFQPCRQLAPLDKSIGMDEWFMCYSIALLSTSLKDIDPIRYYDCLWFHEATSSRFFWHFVWTHPVRLLDISYRRCPTSIILWQLFPPRVPASHPCCGNSIVLCTASSPTRRSLIQHDVQWSVHVYYKEKFHSERTVDHLRQLGLGDGGLKQIGVSVIHLEK